jgi:WxcM-like, C-terminal
MTDFPAYDDERGVLVPIELDDAAFAPRRVFVVTGPSEGSTRGGHEVTCREQVVLVSGRAELRIDDRTVVLDRPGASALVEPGERMDYELGPGGSTIVVLADRPWQGART